MDVLFILPPFSPENSPSLGLSLLKACLKEKNISSRIHYSNLFYMNNIHELYDKMSFTSGHYLLFEHIFSPQAFPELKHKHIQFEQDFKDTEFATSIDGVTIKTSEVIDLRDKAGDFLRKLAEDICSQNPGIIGIQSNFHQVCFAIALAKHIKSINPKAITVMGGFNCVESMGREILNLTDSIDYIFSGEAEEAFTDFCVNALKHKKFPDTPYISCEKIHNLNSLPYPDFDDYFEQIRQVYMGKKIRLAFEAGRGCWWGQIRQCIFCAINGPTVNSRSKSVDRIQEELDYLSRKYQIGTIYPTDYILPRDMTSFVKDNNIIDEFYFEIKPNLSFNNLYILKKNKLSLCQPGIESLNDRLLTILNKGTNAAGNIRFLRDCKSLRIRAMWNIIHHIPGEEADDYREMLKLFPFIIHLVPPLFTNSIVLQRYSLMFENHRDYNIRNFKPYKYYHYAFPENSNFWNLAFYFEGEYENAFKDESLKRDFINSVQYWMDYHKDKAVLLNLIKLNSEAYLVIDTRGHFEQIYYLLDKTDISIINFTFDIRTTKEVDIFLKDQFLADRFNYLLDKGMILKVGERYVHLLNENTRELCLDGEMKDDVIANDRGTTIDKEGLIRELHDDQSFFSKIKMNSARTLKKYAIYLSDNDINLIKKQTRNIFM
ncbi:MAG: RiPP maturation radical SAM C-methyltransferase [Spirochaetota bacterium]|nr:RiPP maturation radical SAM C-methyltransferase [Spirochaetota bacterium]